MQVNNSILNILIIINNTKFINYIIKKTNKIPVFSNYLFFQTKKNSLFGKCTQIVGIFYETRL